MLADGRGRPLRFILTAGQVGDIADGTPRPDAAQEQRLGLVHVADAGKIALVEQRVGNRSIRRRGQIRNRARCIPIRTEEIGPEMVDKRVLVGGRDERDVVQVITHGSDLAGLQDDPDRVRRAPPAFTRPERTPGAVHPQVGVQGRAGAGRIGQAE